MGQLILRGIKKVKKGTRLFELIDISGGELENADLSRVNLSSILKDEQKIIIPYKIIESSEEKNNSSSNVISNQKTLININYASQNDLEKLTGIGPSMAKRIIDYRNENGLFNSIEDIKNISRNWRS